MRLPFVFFILFLFVNLTVHASENARLLVHLLDYLSVDYSGAVQQGRVVNAAEYEEMKEFTKRIEELGKDFKKFDAETANLKLVVENKGPEKLIVDLTQKIRKEVIQLAGIAVAPFHTPNLKEGMGLFQKNCVLCHGKEGRGDGPSAQVLTPRPSNFYDAERMEKLTPFQAYNAIRLGVEGTAMAGFQNFSDEEVWNLAFYVVSLRHQNRVKPPLTKPEISLEVLANISDFDLKTKVASETELANVRCYSAEKRNAKDFLVLATTLLTAIPADLEAKNYPEARNKALKAYLEGIEPLEPKLKATDPGLLVEVESRMAALRNLISEKVSVVQFTERMNPTVEFILSLENKLSQVESPRVTFGIAFGIVMRESFEVILLIVTLLGILKSFGLTKEIAMVHFGWISSVVVGFLLWMASDFVFSFSGFGREMLEGIVSAIAVIVVLYMGIWLHQKAEIGKWKKFIQEQIHLAANEKSRATLFVIAFFASFREVFETVLFLKALALQNQSQQDPALLFGVLAAFLFSLVLAVLMLRLSARIPLRQLFLVSSWVMILLAFVLTGKALHAFQESGFITITPVSFPLRLDSLGIFPTYETFISQLCVMLLSFFFLWWTSRAKKSA